MDNKVEEIIKLKAIKQVIAIMKSEDYVITDELINQLLGEEQKSKIYRKDDINGK